MSEVWVVEHGSYSSRCVTGVYATAEAAKADHPIPPITVHEQRRYDEALWYHENGNRAKPHPIQTEWTWYELSQSWSFDRYDGIDITRYEVQA